MAFFPHVKKGDAFQPSALLENNIRDVVNGYNAIGARVTKGVANSSLRVPRLQGRQSGIRLVQSPKIRCNEPSPTLWKLLPALRMGCLEFRLYLQGLPEKAEKRSQGG